MPDSTVTTSHPAIVKFDMVDSTKGWQAIGYQNYEAQVRGPIFEICKRLQLQNVGQPLGSHEGDGMLLLFDTVNHAFQFACEFQREIAEKKIVLTGNDGKPLPGAVRVAVHYAKMEMIPDANGDYRLHPEVVTVSRVIGSAHTAQIIATEAAMECVDEDDWQHLAYGNRRIKSFDETPSTLYELLYDGVSKGVPGEQFFPDWFVEKNQYIPRKEKENEILNYFRTRKDGYATYRLVSLHGFGGMGKTRLAVQCAINVIGVFEGRVHLVKLENAPLYDENNTKPTLDYLAAGIGKALGLDDAQFFHDTLLKAFERGKTADATRQEELLQKSRLVVLDNYESVNCDACRDWIGRLLMAAPALHLLVTGRKIVENDEIEQGVDIESMTPEEARELFLNAISRKRNLNQKPLTSNDEIAIENIFRLTERIPLALELVAARTKNDSLTEIAAGLEKTVVGEFTALQKGHGRLDTSPRHHSLEKSLEWSYQRLSEGGRTAFHALGIYAESVCATSLNAVLNETDARDRLTDLRESALVNRIEDNDGTSRYTMLRPTREYAQQN